MAAFIMETRIDELERVLIWLRLAGQHWSSSVIVPDIFKVRCLPQWTKHKTIAANLSECLDI